jgi:hypothetical protein
MMDEYSYSLSDLARNSRIIVALGFSCRIATDLALVVKVSGMLSIRCRGERK